MKSMGMAVALVCAMAASASAKDLGEAGAMSINGNFQLSLASVSSDAENSESVTVITVAPNGDLFVAPGVSLGGGLLVRYQSQGDNNATDLGLQARAGYYLPLGNAGLWITAGVAYLHGSQHIEVGPISGDSDIDIFELQLYVPLVIHLAPGFFFGLGPSISQEIVRDDGEDATDEPKFRVLGITSIVGGAW